MDRDGRWEKKLKKKKKERQTEKKMIYLSSIFIISSDTHKC